MWNRNEMHERRVAPFGGERAVRVWILPISPAPPFTVALACELEPAGRVGAHVQQEDSELLVVIEGEGVAIVDGTPRLVGPGSVTALALGATLALDNGSPTLHLRYLILKARPPRQ